MLACHSVGPPDPTLNGDRAGKRAKRRPPGAVTHQQQDQGAPELPGADAPIVPNEIRLKS